MGGWGGGGVSTKLSVSTKSLAENGLIRTRIVDFCDGGAGRGGGGGGLNRTFCQKFSVHTLFLRIGREG